MYELPMISAVVGASLSLSSWYFLRATFEGHAAFDVTTLEAHGALFTLVIFMMTGPVLALEALWPAQGGRIQVLRRCGALALFGIWSTALGITIIGLLTLRLQ